MTSAGSKKKTASASHKTDSPDRKRTPGKLAIKLKAKPERNSKVGLSRTPRRTPGRIEPLAAAQSAQVDGRKAKQNAESTEIAKVAIDAALDKKALLPVLIDVSAMASYTDFIAIVSGRSDRHVDAIAEGVLQAMKARGRTLLGQEGTGSGRWTLLDFGDVVVHVFYHPVREFYDLESLWVDAPRLPLKIPPESVMAQPDALYGNL
ncbi:MAG TPA: ribosome silencing factor [Polyangia bacterium]